MAEKQPLPEWSAILKDRWDREPKEWRDAFIDDLGVNAATVYRWREGRNGPDNKYKLTILEKHIPEIAAALHRQYSSFYVSSQDLVLRTVAPVYARVHQALARTDASLLMDAVVGIVLYALVNHLDVENVGVVALLGQLLSTSSNGRADHLMMNAWSAEGTGPWIEDRAEKSYLAGDESLSALAAKSGRAVFYPRDLPSLPWSTGDICHRDVIQSAAAYPILRSAHVAGVIFLASTQPDYFTSQRREIIEQYALMISLAFHDSDFYPRSAIQVHTTDELQSFADYQRMMKQQKTVL